MKRFIISESEKQSILKKHAQKGLSLSEKISDLFDENVDMENEYSEMDEIHDKIDVYEEDGFTFPDPDASGNMSGEQNEDMYEGIGYHDNIDSDYFHEKTGGMYSNKPNKSVEDIDFDMEDDMEDDMGDEVENPKYEKSLSSSDEEIMYEIEIGEDDEDAPFEKGPRGMRAARTRADFDPTPREIEMTGVFGKHGEDVPPTTIRYMRKNPDKIIKRLADMYGTDKIKNWLSM